MTTDEILSELPTLTFEELQLVINRIQELRLERARNMSEHPSSEEQQAKVEAMLVAEKRFRDSLGFTTTPEEIDRAKRDGRL